MSQTIIKKDICDNIKVTLKQKIDNGELKIYDIIKRRGYIWESFGVLANCDINGNIISNTINTEYIVCKYCKSIFQKSTGISSLKYHLQYACKNNLNNIVQISRDDKENLTKTCI